MSKKKVELKLIFDVLAVVLSVVAICMIFVKSVAVQGLLKAEYTGFEATFGCINPDTELSFLNFSFMNLLPYILLVCAVLLVILSMCGIVKGKLAKYLACAFMVASGVLFFCIGAFVVPGDFYVVKVTTELAVGSIVAGCASLVAGALECLTFVLKTKKKRK